MENKQDRNKKILGLIIKSYIEQAKPISSKLVSRKIGFSSATIRNIMSELEEMGYIIHPHTSAGRVPTDKGYRYYVDSIMRKQDFTEDEMTNIKNIYNAKKENLEGVIKTTLDLLSTLSEHTAFVLFPFEQETGIEHVDFVRIASRKVAVNLFTDSGLRKSFVIEFEKEITPDRLEKITKFINEHLRGFTFTEAAQYLNKAIEKEEKSLSYISNNIKDIIQRTIFEFYADSMFWENEYNIINSPEFNSTKKMKDLLKLFNNKTEIFRIIEQDLKSSSIKIHIGCQHKDDVLSECTMITSPYGFNKKTGLFGVIGPMRMEYERIVPLMEKLSEITNVMIKDILEY